MKEKTGAPWSRNKHGAMARVRSFVPAIGERSDAVLRTATGRDLVSQSASCLFAGAAGCLPSADMTASKTRAMLFDN
jgi:hypothetical protein